MSSSSNDGSHSLAGRLSHIPTPTTPTMQINRGTEYAIRAALYLTIHQDRTPILVADIAEAISAPVNYLSNILQSLTRFNIIQAHRGARRGYSLAAPAEEINLLQIVEALEGPLAVHCCSTIVRGECPLNAACCVTDVFHDLQELIRERLARTSLADATGRSGETLCTPEAQNTGTTQILGPPST